MKRLSGKKVLITGAASGIGRATAIAMGKSGCHLFLTDINGDGLRKTAESITGAGGKVYMAQVLDVSQYQAMKAFAKKVHEDYGVLDILINVAGIALFSKIEDMQHRDWEKIMEVNLWGVIHGLECFIPEMIRAGKGGHVVTVSSTAGIIGLPWHAAYAGSKHALLGISEALRYDLKKHNIGVSVICPGAVNTELVQNVRIHANKEGVEKGRRLFLKIATTPEKAALSIMKAIRTGKFLNITSFDIQLLYFAKKYFFPVYHFVMMIISRMMDKILIRGLNHQK